MGAILSGGGGGGGLKLPADGQINFVIVCLSQLSSIDD